MAKFTDVISGLTESTDPQGDSDYIVGYDGTSVVKILIDNLGSAVSLDALGAPSDSTSLNASTDAHGLLPKLDGNVANYLTGIGTWAAASGGGASSSDIILTGSDSDLPAAETEGRLYLASDGASIYRDTGAAWESWGGLWKFIQPTTVSDTDSWAWINQTGITATKKTKTVFFENTGTDNSNGVLYKAAPSTPYTITSILAFMAGASDNSEFGICFLESSSGKIHSITMGKADGMTIYTRKWTDYATYSGSYATTTFKVYTFAPFVWLRITDDGTDRKVYWSFDGINFVLLHSVGRTDFLTADKIGLVLRKGAADIKATILSWEES